MSVSLCPRRSTCNTVVIPVVCACDAVGLLDFLRALACRAQRRVPHGKKRAERSANGECLSFSFCRATLTFSRRRVKIAKIAPETPRALDRKTFRFVVLTLLRRNVLRRNHDAAFVRAGKLTNPESRSER